MDILIPRYPSFYPAMDKNDASHPCPWMSPRGLTPPPLVQLPYAMVDPPAQKRAAAAAVGGINPTLASSDEAAAALGGVDTLPVTSRDMPLIWIVFFCSEEQETV